MLEAGPIRLVGMTREDTAGFAADAYARINGVGLRLRDVLRRRACRLCNSIAGAYAEKSPVIVLSGSPGLSERARNPLLHHKVKGFETQFEVFEKITVAVGRARRPVDRLQRDRPGARGGARGTSGRSTLRFPRDQVHGRPVEPAPDARAACRRAIPTRSARPSTRRPRCSPRRSGR